MSHAPQPSAAPLLWLVVNAASGSNDDASVAQLIDAFAAAGRPAERTIRFPEDDLPTRAALDEAGVGTLAVFTGDGTANSQVRHLIGWDGEVLVLPGGTQNLLAKALHGEDCTADAVVAAFAEGRLTRQQRPAVETSQGPALVEVLAGPGATWADVREGVRDLDIGTIASALGEAVRTTASGPTVRVIDPALGKPEGYRALRIDAGTGTLTLDGYDAQGIGDVAAQGVAMLVKRDFRAGPHDKLGTCDRLTCASDAPIALMIDGERHDGDLRETFACITLPVHFLASAAPGG
ncbi:diacylglycerol kinase family protein [Novosphingobium sp. KCTC 2891]|uniref:diacylglycerol kinase family protein n=1 Tax=Novosphingobium sp. KCTC 2891 TaxID=2989730 RepID=UPI002223AEC4|nr:diacylglycerol kinase family protein [Novosphingobium sp. KCTC 2891]MCW1383327.1 diacylglycerol kinase family protein [Novosphingobium sp. KCTC 2891]